MAVAAAALMAFATLTHSLVERPGIQAGRWASRKVAAALGGRAGARPNRRSEIERPEPQPQSF